LVLVLLELTQQLRQIQVIMVLTHLFSASRVLVAVVVAVMHLLLLVVQEVLVVVATMAEIQVLVDLELQDKEIQVAELLEYQQLLQVVVAVLAQQEHPVMHQQMLVAQVLTLFLLGHLLHLLVYLDITQVVVVLVVLVDNLQVLVVLVVDLLAVHIVMLHRQQQPIQVVVLVQQVLHQAVQVQLHLAVVVLESLLFVTHYKEKLWQTEQN
jgi:hypothetical protein